MQQIKKRPLVKIEETVSVRQEQSVVVHIPAYPAKTLVSTFDGQEPLSYKQQKEAKALALLEYTALKQAFEQFSLRTADNLLVQNTDHLSSIVGLLGAEVTAIHRILFGKEQEKSEQSLQKETEYLRSLLR